MGVGDAGPGFPDSLKVVAPGYPGEETVGVATSASDSDPLVLVLPGVGPGTAVEGERGWRRYGGSMGVGGGIGFDYCIHGNAWGAIFSCDGEEDCFLHRALGPSRGRDKASVLRSGERGLGSSTGTPSVWGQSCEMAKELDDRLRPFRGS